MANKILKDYQGPTIKIDGVCYTWIGETTSSVNTTPDSFGFGSAFNIGIMSAFYPSLPTLSDYRIKDGQFGSYTAPNGITYTWARGTGW